ncbi:HD domain-containing phosphohydrolase [Pseudomonas sp. CAU 1711]|uniref:HD domain-containing phosphohydrolase n=1 Tax=Pseudomonas sp. CAU 1711 TaxID=3140356 RepID=UPI003261ACEC
MQGKSVIKERRFPLHVHISVLFTFLLLGSGAALGLFNYYQTTQVILSSSNQLFAQMRAEVESNLQHTYQPIRHLLGLLALNENNQSADGYQRMSLLPLFARALNDNPKLASLYLGYEDGDFFMVRPLRDARLKRIFDAPENAAFQVWTIDRSGEARPISESQYFDAELNWISRRQNLKEIFDPRTRPWYRGALESGAPITTDPYVFFSTQDIGTTLAQISRDKTVLAADLTLADLSETLARHRVTPSTEVVLYRPDGAAVAYPDMGRLVVSNGTPHLNPVDKLSPALGELFQRGLDEDRQGSMRLAGKRWRVSYSQLDEGGPNGLRLALLAPEEELLADAYRIRWQGAVLTIGILLLCIPIGWMTSRILVRPLRALVDEAEAIRSFNFAYPASGHSPVLEINQLAVAMGKMKDTLSSFLDITASLSAETRFDALLRRVLRETVDLSEASAGLLYLREADSGRLEPHGLFVNNEQHSLDEHRIPTYVPGETAIPDWVRQPAEGGVTTVASIGFDQADGLQSLLHTLDSPRVHLIGTGLHNRQGETVGVLLLLHRDTGEEPALLRPQRIAYVEAVSGVAALCIESQRLLEQQKKLLDAFIQLIAGAIDAKSPYTGGHCQRVPELTLMLARATAASDAEPFRGYNPSDEEWEALHIAAWLHDCGKVTTPEYVVDKATKLETIYDRIHEVRMRFELLKRDAWSGYWEGLAKGGDEAGLAALRDETLSTLDEEFAFVARCNLGGEAMAEADQERLRRIASRTWTRTLDDRLGVSWEENQRQARTPAPMLPVQEPLLADKPEHLFERPESELIPPDNPWGFKLDVPQHKYNRGELYNLGIARGTLTAEERYIINNHIVQTILMLDHLPFPRHLANVAEIAGGHHEKMDGSGYPKRLKREEMSLPARMMAIADIFEALTAVDRPYKQGKTLSEALGIMAGMCRNAHVDPQLFGLFLQSGIAHTYAQRYLRPEQIDALDVPAILAKAGLA